MLGFGFRTFNGIDLVFSHTYQHQIDFEISDVSKKSLSVSLFSLHLLPPITIFSPAGKLQQFSRQESATVRKGDTVAQCARLGREYCNRLALFSFNDVKLDLSNRAHAGLSHAIVIATKPRFRGTSSLSNKARLGGDINNSVTYKPYSILRTEAIVSKRVGRTGWTETN